METGLFDEVGDVLRALLPPDLGAPRHRAHRYGIKVWFGAAKPQREHYEAQVIGPSHVEGAEVLALEVGFHVEHPRPVDNEQVMAHLLSCEPQWRRHVGDEAVAGPFLGQRDDWGRISETWPDPNLSDPTLGFEIATRLVDYAVALEPLVRAR